MDSSSRQGSFLRRRRRPHKGKTELVIRDDGPFSFTVHRNVKPVLTRIGVPEPRPFVPDPFQVEALEAIADSDVLVTAPTGAGKTYIAVEAIRHFHETGGRSWYASPLKALSNAKFEEFGALFGAENVGILTGDRKENTTAPIIVGTTEILRNQLYDTMHRAEDLEVDLIVLDEAHYLGDKDRGVVWEEVLIYLPPRVRLLLLSATIRNADEICGWLRWIRGAECRWVAAYERPVPLYPLFLFPNGELGPLSTRKGLFGKIHSVDRKSYSRNEFPNIAKVMETLRKANLLPAIFFLKSRSDCEKSITLCPPSVQEKPGAAADFRNRVEDLLETYPFLRQHQHLPILKKAHVGAHHGGQLPHWKLFLERLMQEGLLDAILSTSTVAAGVNFPARSVVIFQSDRFNGREFVELTATDLLQMTGRAGRRGMDEIGFVLTVPGPHQDPQLIHDLLRSPPDAITSQIRVNFSMILNILLSHSPEEVRTLFAASLATYQNLNREAETAEELEAARQELEDWMPQAACRTVDRLVQVRPQFLLLRDHIRKGRKFLKKQSSYQEIEDILAPGRPFYSQRGTPYVTVGYPEMDHQRVEAVRLLPPLRWRRGKVRTHRVPIHRIRGIGDRLEVVPSLRNVAQWERISALLDSDETRTKARDLWASTPLHGSARELLDFEAQKETLPCNNCELFAPCQKGTAHPFTASLQRYFDARSRIDTVQDQLWRSFQEHFALLQSQGYVDPDGRLTEDGQWASKLRLDQPLLISEGIRKNLFPDDRPELLAALIAPFVMDRERPSDMQLSTLVWKYPDLAKPYFKMLHSLQPLRDLLQSNGFNIPPLPFWTLVTVYHWALGESWDSVRLISSMDEGDLAMVVLRTADHLRQIESLSDTHPKLAASARQAIDTILREPVLVE